MAESSYNASSTDARTNRDSIKKGFDEFKRFASTNLTRAVQYVTEKTGKADTVTEFDSDFETLCLQLDTIKSATEKMVNYVEAIVEPNPNVRWENWARTKIDKPKSEHISAHLLLSAELAKVANSFGSDSQFGAYLVRCSDVESKLGESHKRFQETAVSEYIIPLKAFLEVDVKSVLRERKHLGVLRLDLDAARSKARKAQGEEKLQAAEEELGSVQADYDTQLQKTRTSLKRIVDTHVSHMGYMRKFMSAQRAYYSECQAHLDDIEGSFSSPSATPLNLSEEPASLSTKLIVGDIELDRDESYKGKMIYDYEALKEGELTVNAGETLTVFPLADDDDYIMAEYEGRFGKVLSSYIEKV